MGRNQEFGEMGNSGSSSSATDNRFSYASRSLRSFFDSLAAQSQSNGNYVSPPALKAYIGIDGLLGDRVFYLVSRKRRDQKLNFEDLVIAKCYRMWKVIVVEDIRKWCAFLPSARKFLCSLLMPFDSGSQIPQLLHQDHVDPSLIVLKKEYAWHIGGALPQYELEEWKLLYHSAVHGSSYNTFFGNIPDDGPTLLIIKD